MSIVLSLDVGTTSLSAIALNPRGEVIRVVQRDHAADVPGLPSGRAEQSPTRIRAAAWETLRELTSGLDATPAALGLTGQMHGGLLLDAARRPLSNLITWQDRRALEPTSDAPEGRLQELHQRSDPAVWSRAGCRLAAGYLGATLATLHAASELPEGFQKAALIIDWLASELTGSDLCTDRSNAASTGLFDLADDRWSPDLLELCGVERDWLPEVKESGALVGVVSGEAAAATGLPQGLPVCVGIGDNQAAILGSVPAGERVVQINIGTGGQISWGVDRFLHVEGMDTRYLPRQRFMLVGAGLAGGDAFAWVKRTIQAWLMTFGAEIPEAEIYGRLVELVAASPPDAGGLVCEPFFRGTRRHPKARGIFREIIPDNFLPGNVGRAVLQGIAEGMHSFRDVAGAHWIADARRIIATGNAVRRNPLLAAELANRFQLPVDAPVHEEEAAYGAALLAGVETGIWESVSAAGAQIAHQRLAEPN